jgi:hypothetical protein
MGNEPFANSAWERFANYVEENTLLDIGAEDAALLSGFFSGEEIRSNARVREALEEVAAVMEKCGCLDCCCSGSEVSKTIRSLLKEKYT